MFFGLNDNKVYFFFWNWNTYLKSSVNSFFSKCILLLDIFKKVQLPFIPAFKTWKLSFVLPVLISEYVYYKSVFVANLLVNPSSFLGSKIPHFLHWPKPIFFQRSTTLLYKRHLVCVFSPTCLSEPLRLKYEYTRAIFRN